jgi:hypothetical protein
MSGICKCQIPSYPGTNNESGLQSLKKVLPDLEIRRNPAPLNLFPVELLQELIRSMRDILRGPRDHQAALLRRTHQRSSNQ